MQHACGIIAAFGQKKRGNGPYPTAHLLSNDKNQTATEVRQAYEDLLAEMEQAPTPSESLAAMLSTFRKAPESYLAALEEKLSKERLPT